MSDQNTEAQQEPEQDEVTICPVCHSNVKTDELEISDEDLSTWARYVMGAPRFQKTYEGPGGITVTLQTRLPAEARDIDRGSVRSGMQTPEASRASVARLTLGYSVKRFKLPNQVAVELPDVDLKELQKAELNGETPQCIERLQLVEGAGARPMNGSDFGFITDCLYTFERLTYLMFIRTRNEGESFFAKALEQP